MSDCIGGDGGEHLAFHMLGQSMSLRNLVFLFVLLAGWKLHAVEVDFDFLEPSQTNIIYGMDHGAALLLDVYEPQQKNGYALIFVMGTGYTAYGGYSDLPLKNLDRWLLEQGIFPNAMGENRQLFAPAVEAGFTVFSINHRLSPRNHWETQVRDVLRAVQYVRANASAFDVSPDWIGGMGHSSGASLIALAATVEEAADASSIDPVARVSSRIQAAVPVSGLHDLLSAMQETPGVAPMVSGYVGRVISYQPPGHDIFKEYMAASPVHNLDPSDPPMLLIHCIGDDVVSVKQSEALARGLESHGISHELHAIPNGDHGAVFDISEFVPMVYAAEWLVKQLPQ